MVFRALAALILLPGTIAILIPWFLLTLEAPPGNGSPIGIGFFIAGLFMLIDCMRSLLLHGNGTLAPWDPPERLVIEGLYRFLRNPMYLSIILFIFGLGLLHGSKLILLYDVGLWTAFHIRVRMEEEPLMARRYGESWFRYQRHVRRWVPRLSPWIPRSVPIPVEPGIRRMR